MVSRRKAKKLLKKDRRKNPLKHLAKLFVNFWNYPVPDLSTYLDEFPIKEGLKNEKYTWKINSK